VTIEHPAPDAAPPGRQEILDDIERTREQMGQTVEALAAKADVKAQAQRKAAEVAAAARQQGRRAVIAGQRRPWLTVAAAGAVAGLVTWILTRPMRR
jgi:Protein of unknown function (DUF3618)